MKKLTVMIMSSVALAAAGAEFDLPAVTGDNMVLQQQTDARLWGFDRPSTEVEVRPSWTDTVYRAVTGPDGRWDVAVATPAASFDPHTITFATADTVVTVCDVLVGEVWLCSGQSNMEMPVRGFSTQPVEGALELIKTAGRYPGVRVITVPKAGAYEPCRDFEADWKVSTPANVYDFTAIGYMFGRELTDLLDVPVGIISCAYGGSKVEGWLPRHILDTYPDWDMEAERDSTMLEWQRIGVMYNAMLNPVIGYTVRGFLWNQGESNVGRHHEYAEHQADMVSEWRRLWGGAELPFYFVELPGWEYGNPEGIDAALLRESQHRAAAMLPSCGIVCTSDLVGEDEVGDIHASRKAEIAERLAMMAGARTYGIEGLPDRYPTYRSMQNDGERAVLTFDNAWSGFTPNEELPGFEVCGTDGVFRPARALQDWDDHTVTVSRPEGVDRIEAVRYCFKNFAIGRVHDLTGMPLVPFRTDK
ncbi:MAG: sialate O-acetylesterase [Bacteroidales bacterium]|nr:sialate O-acetylesterase [Bacteroidales bacterium]